MKRSRYSATMSRCFGSSNQSRERKRRDCFCRVSSDAMGHNSLRQSRHVYACAEQTTGERLCFPFLGAERNVRGGDVQSLQVIVTKGRLGDGGAGQLDLAQQLASG